MFYSSKTHKHVYSQWQLRLLTVNNLLQKIKN